jgi:hypothetical protein
VALATSQDGARKRKEATMIDAFKTNGSSPPVDVQVEKHGTIFLLRPLTDVAHDWVDEHLPTDAIWWCGAIVVEHRYIGPIVGGAIGDGLVVR